MLPDHHELRHSALLVVDMQEHFREMGVPIVARLNAAIGACRSAGLPIVFTQHGHKQVELDSGQLGKFWGNSEMIRYGSAAWRLLPELDVREADYKIDEKRRYDAFHGTCLDEVLRQMQMDSVIICGVMTNLCCETTARSAFCRDYRVLFMSDGCGTSSAELHNASLANIRYGFGTVLTSAELLAKFANLTH